MTHSAQDILRSLGKTLLVRILAKKHISKLTREKTTCANEITKEFNKQVRKWGLIIRCVSLSEIKVLKQPEAIPGVGGRVESFNYPTKHYQGYKQGDETCDFFFSNKFKLAVCLLQVGYKNNSLFISLNWSSFKNNLKSRVNNSGLRSWKTAPRIGTDASNSFFWWKCQQQHSRTTCLSFTTRVCPKYLQ